MEITSIAFSHGQYVPEKYTCKGPNISPPLRFLNVPVSAQSLVLVVQDLDSSNDWIHWLVYNIPAHVDGFDEGKIPPKAVDGICNGGTTGYEGPCPVYFSGVHRYSFKLYALDVVLQIPEVVDSKTILNHSKGHIITTAELIGVAQGEK
jgi:hypothetical protein